MIKGGPKIVNDGLVLCLDAHDAKSYHGEPVTNLASDSFYTWVNSGAWTSNTYTSHESSPVGFPPGLKGTTGVQVLEGICTTAGSIHFGTGHVNPASASTQYTYSVWFYQKDRAGIGAPYARANVSNSNLGTMKYNGTTGSSNWPVNKWIKLEITFTTQSSDTQTYISNYIGSQVGDTMYLCAPQSEQKSYYSPFADSSRPYNLAWRNRVSGDYAAFYNEAATNTGHYRDGQVIMPVSASHVDFDGTNDMVTFYNNAGLFRWMPSGTTYNNNLSVEAWFKIDSSDTGYIISYPWNGNGEYNWYLTTSYVYFQGRNGSNPDDGGVQVDISGGSINDGNWHQLVGIATPNSVKAYIDGSLHGSTSHPRTSTAPQYGATQHSFAIMTLYPYGTWASGNTSFSTNGQFAIARIYNRELTATEVLQNYNATKKRFS